MARKALLHKRDGPSLNRIVRDLHPLFCLRLLPKYFALIFSGLSVYLGGSRARKVRKAPDPSQGESANARSFPRRPEPERLPTVSHLRNAPAGSTGKRSGLHLLARRQCRRPTSTPCIVPALKKPRKQFLGRASPSAEFPPALLWHFGPGRQRNASAVLFFRGSSKATPAVSSPVFGKAPGREPQDPPVVCCPVCLST